LPDAAGASTNIDAIANQTKIEYSLSCLVNGPAATKDNEPPKLLEELLNVAAVTAGTSRMFSSVSAILSAEVNVVASFSRDYGVIEENRAYLPATSSL
jgi:hypothetical protein